MCCRELSGVGSGGRGQQREGGATFCFAGRRAERGQHDEHFGASKVLVQRGGRPGDWGASCDILLFRGAYSTDVQHIVLQPQHEPTPVVHGFLLSGVCIHTALQPLYLRGTTKPRDITRAHHARRHAKFSPTSVRTCREEACAQSILGAETTLSCLPTPLSPVLWPTWILPSAAFCAALSAHRNCLARCRRGDAKSNKNIVGRERGYDHAVARTMRKKKQTCGGGVRQGRHNNPREGVLWASK